ncbi:glyoxalase [Sphingomonas sp. UYP23]
MKRLSTIILVTLLGVTSATSPAFSKEAPAPSYSVGLQYDTTHVYVAPEDFDRFVASLVATFGGAAKKQGVFQVTPTASLTISQVVVSPAGSISVFGFKTQIPYPFGLERSGYLVTDMDAAVTAARKAGAIRLVETFPDPIGRDVVVQWPGGVNMQLYWHTTAPDYPAPQTISENRVYLTADAADAFVRSWTSFSKGHVVSDDKAAPGAEIGEPGKTYRRIRVTSGYGDMAVLVSDGALPWPYGRELTGYAVQDLALTLAKASASGVETLVPEHAEAGRQSAVVRFPGGYIAEIHSKAA